MLDIKFIRKNSDKVQKGCQKKGVKIDIDRILKLDEKRREILNALDDFRFQKNQGSKNIILAKTEKDKKKIISKMREVDKKSDKIQKNFKEINKEFNDLMLLIPNLPLEDVPTGKDDSENVVLKEIGEKPKFDFKPKDYLEIAEKLDLIDVKRAGKVSGSRFGYLKNEAVLLEFALINFAFNTLLKEDFIPIMPPVMVNSESMKAMGYIATKEDLAERYFFAKDNLFLVGTAEQSVGPMHRDEILTEKELPKRYAAFSTCFREEAGSYGKDTKGILRVHQFDKVEMFSLTKSADSKKEHKFFLEMEQKLMDKLDLPYRVIRNCSGDMAFPTATQFDIETWIPSQQKYRETHSTSNCTDFQARRLNIRYRNSQTQKLEFVHTVNGTAFAIGRMIIAIIENYQQKDSSVKIPRALRSYLEFDTIK